MIPWFELHTLAIGPISIQVWGTLVALGFLAAAWVAARRAKQQGINSNHIWNLAPWILVAAFVSARLFHVFFYDPAWFWLHPWDIINPTLPGYSMMGGVIGGVVAGLIYVRYHKLNLWTVADLVAYALPLGTGIGRIGCFLIHDHPGTLTHFFLSVKYPDGVRHDHGLYLSL
ncbi:MAG: prolipoprotein diacylglyceryl transferase family protein [Patescibacteria group bacterium]